MTRALFVGGDVDNSELDLDGRGAPPLHYPENTGAGRARYRLHHVGRRDNAEIAYAVYAAPEMGDHDVQRITDERDYARRFEARPETIQR